VRASPTAVRMEGKPDGGERGRLGDGGTRGARPGHNGVVAREAARRRDPKGGAVGPGRRREHSKGKSEGERSLLLNVLVYDRAPRWDTKYPLHFFLFITS
jgi:hypothetical protein